jgi:uncharacterized protein YndB with AHSA1/START domain
MKVARRRVVPAAQEEVWELVSDPAQLPRWWPDVARVEEATPEAWTKVLTSRRGKDVRADFTRVEYRPPHRLVWRQEVEESPFERILSESVTAISLEPDAGGGTEVELRLVQKLRGLARFGGLMVRRAAAKRLEAALDGLEQTTA